MDTQEKPKLQKRKSKIKTSSERKSSIKEVLSIPITALKTREYERLRWMFPGMIRIRTDMDGSCFFHAICKSYFKPYIVGKTKSGKSINRKKFVRSLRRDLSKTLGKPINPEDPSSKTWYETVSNGECPKISKSLPKYELKNMVKELDSSSPISNIYNEFISDQLDKDIYILDGQKRDVYMTGTDDKLLYKNRQSIVILYLPGHYELIGVKDGDYFQTVFEPDSDFIQTIRKRMNELRK